MSETVNKLIYSINRSMINSINIFCPSVNQWSDRWRIFFYQPFNTSKGRGSSVGIATGYGLDGPKIESRWGSLIFRSCPYRPWGPPSLLYKAYRVFSGGKERPGRDADPSYPSSAVIKKDYNYTSNPIMGRKVRTTVYFTFFPPRVLQQVFRQFTSSDN